MRSEQHNILSSDHLTVDLGQRTARGGVIAFVAQILRILSQLAIVALMARLLAPKDFGLMAMAMTVTGFVGIFTDLGLSAATVQQKEIDQATVTTLFYINLAIGCALTLVCLAAAPLAAWFFADRRLLWLIVAMGLSIPVSAAGAQHGALLQRQMRWMEMQWTPILAQIAGGIAGVLLAWKGGIGYWALVAQAWVGAAVSTALLWRFTNWRPDFTPHWRHARSALHFGLNLTGFNFVNYFHRQFDNVLVGWRWGATSLGYYNNAYTLLTLPLTLISGPISSAIVPALSRLQDDPERWRSAFFRAFSGVVLFSSGITAVLIATAEPLVRTIYGAQWGESAIIFRLLSISMFAATPMNAMGWMYMSLGQTSRALRWSLITTPFYVLGFVFGLPFGARGVALFYSITICLAALPCLEYATRHAPFRLVDLLRLSLPSIALGASTLGVSALFKPMLPSSGTLMNLLIVGTLTGGLYCAGAAILVVYDPKLAPLLLQIRKWFRLAIYSPLSRRPYGVR